MIDTLTIVGPLGPPQERHSRALTRMTIGRFSTVKHKPAVTFIDSPLTGAQIDVKYWVESVGSSHLAFASVKIPLASATIGQNYAHAGLESIELEIACAAQLARIALMACGFSEDELTMFMRGTRAELLELTWHNRTASRPALANLMKRTRQLFEGMQAIASRHDAPVRDVDFRQKNSAPCLLVTLKNGDEFRQYPKYDQITAKSNIGKHRYSVSPEIKEKAKALLQEIEAHVRNEIRFGPKTLDSLGLSNPASWTSSTLRGAIDGFWNNAGLEQSRVTSLCDLSRLSPEVRETLEQYEVGETIIERLANYTFTRHRNAILEAGGPDIDPRAQDIVAKAKSVGRQLHYDRRWKPNVDMKQIVLCEVTAPAILEELKQGIEFIADGVIPDFPDVGIREAWLKRWKAFVVRERLWDQPHGVDANEAPQPD
jgi:hypothetical protein